MTDPAPTTPAPPPTGLPHREAGLRLMEGLDPRLVGVLDHDDTSFASEMRELSVDIAFGQVWARPGLSLHDRSLVTLGILIALRAESELEFHLPIALRNGVSYSELEEVVYHSTAYAGFPAAAAAKKVGRRVLPPRDTAPVAAGGTREEQA